jgi:hypothetical protein
MPIHRYVLTMLMAAAAAPLAARAAAPELETLMPLACAAGESQEVKLLGGKLDGVTALWFSHAGIHAAAGEKKGSWTINVDADVPPGDYDVWAVADDGMSVPRRLVISTIAETVEQEKNDDPQTAQQLGVPAAVTGRIDPATDRDYFRIRLARGQMVTIECRSVSLDGTVLPALRLVGPDGRELVNDDGRQAEPRLHYTAQQAGEHLLRIEERAYRKGANNVYRLVVSDAAWLAGAFPSAVARGQQSSVTLYGGMSHGPRDGLPVELDVPGQASTLASHAVHTSALLVDQFDYRHKDYEGSVRFELIDQQPLVEVDEFSDSMSAAVSLKLPAAIAGRFLARNDVDWFRFKAKKDQTIWIEAVAERSGRDLDLEVVVHDAKGKVLQTLADTAQPKDIAARLSLATRDPQDLFKAPADGQYYLAVRDLLGPQLAGPERSYLLLVGRPRQQVAVVAMPSATKQGLAVPAGGKATLDLFVVRRGGHRAPVTIRASQLPEGVTADNATIDAKKSTGALTLRAAADAPSWIGPIELTAETEIDGEPQTVQVQPATAVHEAVPTSARLTQALPLAVLPAAKKK